jgi:Asp-tRNA(Asn)/Glu-tRNA(Gln) amidotransferase A subunit family amidase
METYNNLLSSCQNPYNVERTSGGSSGGEATLVKLGLVNASICSDVGGSIRTPSLCCGLVGFKPT